MSFRFRRFYFPWMISSITLISCAEPRGFLQDSPEVDSTTPRYLYVASGSCYGGGVTTSTGSQLITKFDTSTLKPTVVIDYSTINATDFPIALTDYSSTELLVLVENSSGTRRIDLVDKTTGTASVWVSNGTAFSAQLRAMFMNSDGSVLFSKSSAIEKLSAGKSRLTNGANPYINNPGNNTGIANCSSSNTLASAIVSLPATGKILFAHAAASNNRLALISANGYSTTADCLQISSAPASTAAPTSIVAHSSGKYLVAFGSTTAGSNYIYSYTINESTNAITASVSAAYSNSAVINGPSALAEDVSTGAVYVANGLSTLNSVERFTFDSSAQALTREGSSPIISNSIYSRCISGMVVGD